MVTWLLARPSPGAVNSGMRVVVASKRQSVYGVLMRSSGWSRVHRPPPTGKTLFFFASARKSCFISARRAGSLAARSLACV